MHAIIIASLSYSMVTLLQRELTCCSFTELKHGSSTAEGITML